MPALLGALSALIIIILGSFVGQSITNRRSRREQIAARVSDQQPAAARVPASPGIVPITPNRGDVVRESPVSRVQRQSSPDDWGLRQGRAPRPAAPIRETTRALEDNVRDLLRRLQSELRGEPSGLAPRAAGAPGAAHVPTTQELDAVLAIWRAKRRG